MIRVILFLVLVGAVALGASWVADQNGSMVLLVGNWRIERTLPELAVTLLVLILASILLWSIVRSIWRLPHHVRHAHRARRQAKGRRAVTQGLIAIGAGDPVAARRHVQLARKHASDDPLALLLHAQEAQLSGDRAGAERAFEAMAAREDTRLLGLRGLFVEAQRNDDPVRAVAIAEATLKNAPNSAWASQAVLGFRCAQGDWAGALAILASNHRAGLIDDHKFRRDRAVLLTAQALELEKSDRDRARDLVNEAVKLAPTLVPAATFAARLLSESQQVRKAMRMIEIAWRSHPHPDLADAYAHVRLSDSARERLARVEQLAKMTPNHDEDAREAALAVASAAIDAREFGRARLALAPFVATPTKRVAMLMAEIERADNGDSGRAREWTLRAVHARHDPAWTADGYVSDRWRPVSPVSGRLDAFRWTTPVAALPSERAALDAAGEAFPAIPVKTTTPAPLQEMDEVASGEPAGPSVDHAKPEAERETPASVIVDSEASAVVASRETPAESAALVSPPLFRPRRDLGRDNDRARAAAIIPAIIPLVRAPDDPGVEEVTEAGAELDEESGQAGGWSGFLSRVTR